MVLKAKIVVYSKIVWNAVPLNCTTISELREVVNLVTSMCRKLKSVTYVETRNFNMLLLVNDRLDALFINVFISCLYMFRATRAHHQEDQLVLIHQLV